MNREATIEKLTTLLSRVQQRSRIRNRRDVSAGTPQASAELELLKRVTATASPKLSDSQLEQPTSKPLPIAPPPTPEPVSRLEQSVPRPAADDPIVQDQALPSKATAQPVPSISARSAEVDAPDQSEGEEAQLPVEPLQEIAPSAEARGFVIDRTKPTVEQVGQSVEWDDEPEGTVDLELDTHRVPATAIPSEMEMLIPSGGTPGLYSAEVRLDPAGGGPVEPDERLRLVPEKGPPAAARPIAQPAHRVVLEVNGSIIEAPEIESSTVALFVGADQTSAKKSFVELLDASMAL